MALLGLTQRSLGVITQLLSRSLRVTNPPHVLTSQNFSLLATANQHKMCMKCLAPIKPFQQSSNLKGTILQNGLSGSNNVPNRSITLEYMHRTGKYQKQRKKKNSPLEGRPQLRGVVLKTLIKKPKKPNSANRKCVRLRLSTGKEATAYVPGEGHNLQEHNVVLVQGGKLQDTPGVKLVCVRGKYDLPHVKKK